MTRHERRALQSRLFGELPSRVCCLCAVKKDCGVECGAGRRWCQGQRGTKGLCVQCPIGKCPSFVRAERPHKDQGELF